MAVNSEAYMMAYMLRQCVFTVSDLDVFPIQQLWTVVLIQSMANLVTVVGQHLDIEPQLSYRLQPGRRQYSHVSSYRNVVSSYVTLKHSWDELHTLLSTAMCNPYTWMYVMCITTALYGYCMDSSLSKLCFQHDV